jgi:hypothetical protein
VVRGLKLRAYTVNNTTSLKNYLPGLASNCDPPDLCLLSSKDYRMSLWCLVLIFILPGKT